MNVDLKIAAVYDKLEQKINAVTKAAGPKGDKGDRGEKGDAGLSIVGALVRGWLGVHR